jgi:hypothetical protein
VAAGEQATVIGPRGRIVKLACIQVVEAAIEAGPDELPPPCSPT